MTKTIHLLVIKGADKGKEIQVPSEGARLGRSSKSDIVLVDPQLSRHHCRLFFKPGDGLWIADLGSANQTVVNNKPIIEVRLRVGDIISVGDSVLKVVNDGGSAPTTPPSTLPSAPQVTAPAVQPRPAVEAPVTDLGLIVEKKKPEYKFGMKPLLAILAAAVLLMIIAWLPKFLKKHKPVGGASAPPVTRTSSENLPLQIEFEKVQADNNNIFRYYLSLDRNGLISVQIDDIKNNRRIKRSKPVDPEYLRRLTQTMADSSFFSLSEEYPGSRQPGLIESTDLSMSIGPKTHRSKVMNRVEPEAFRAVRERIEEFGKNELGLVAIQYSADKLTDMAREAYLLGCKLYDEREIKFANLANAIRTLNEGEWYLETVDPKPDFYGKILAMASDCQRELNKKYEDVNFRAARAINMREWDDAARELRTILELIPDNADQRHKDARKKLLDVESRQTRKP